MGVVIICVKRAVTIVLSINTSASGTILRAVVVIVETSVISMVCL